MRIKNKLYKCNQCGFEKMIETNHYGECYSLGNYNVCPKCPPYKKYPFIIEGGVTKVLNGMTTWECLEKESVEVC